MILQTMKDNAKQEKILGRFAKVLSFYWDGIPVPHLLVSGERRSQTFPCRQLAFTPDYHGEIANIPLCEPAQSTLFVSLSSLVKTAQPASCRIGAHYSPFVGLFCFREGIGSRNGDRVDEKLTIRIPLELCERTFETGDEAYMTRCSVRNAQFVALYRPLIKERLPPSRDSLRNIIVLSTRGHTSVSAELVAKEICDVNEEYTSAMAEAVFRYMCLNASFRRIVQPLQVVTDFNLNSSRVKAGHGLVDKSSRSHFQDAREQLKQQLLWSPLSRRYFEALAWTWETKLSKLLFLDTKSETNSVDVVSFFSQLSQSMSSVISRVRIEFYASVEESFFAFVPNSKEALLMHESDFGASEFRRIFRATDVFLAGKLRSFILNELDGLVQFFDCDGRSSVANYSKRARKLPSLRVELVTSECAQPRAPAMALLQFGISDLFAEMEACASSLPRAACAVLRTLKLEDAPLHILSHVELASYRAAIAEIVSATEAVVGGLSTSYKDFCTIPIQSLAVAKTGSAAEVANHIAYIRQQVTDIRHVSRPIFFCGRLEILCGCLQDDLAKQWTKFLSLFISTFQGTIAKLVDDAEKKSGAVFRVFDTMPSSVEELEAYVQNMEAARSLARDLCRVDCVELIRKVECLETLFIPVEPLICRAVSKFMRLPDELLCQADKVGDMRTKCAPLLKRKLIQLRSSTRQHIQTLSTGVTELYHLFSADTCDIAALTCTELRELVDLVVENLRSIAHEEEVLGLPAENTFDDFPTLLHHFEVIEQFWMAMYDAAKLRDLYNTPIGAVHATASVERVRAWRRLICSSARQLRGFPLLVQIGREQEVALSRYEELELFLELISSPTLRKSHWKNIAKLIAAQLRDGVSSVMDASITVRGLLDAGLLEHLVPLSQIANQAHCDSEVENELEEMRSYGKRTHFTLEEFDAYGVPQTIVAQPFLAEAYSQVEKFLLKCRSMRRYPNLGQQVQKSLAEWEAACEKSCAVLLNFESSQERCTWVEACLFGFSKMRHDKNGTDTHTQAAARCLAAASDAIKSLHTTLRKPQFSLYTAMVQDTVQTVISHVNTTVDEAVEILRRALPQRRAAFPRFRFLSDVQLVNFQFVLAPQILDHLLRLLFPRLASVEATAAEVVAVTAVDGASLHLTTPMSLTQASPDAWMPLFAQTLRTSLMTAVKDCVATFYRVSLESWANLWCGQVLVLALRVLHTEGLRHAVEIEGKDGLHAYAGKASDLCNALSQLARDKLEKGENVTVGNGSFGGAVAAALAYEQFAAAEAQFAIQCGLRTVSDLDSTRILQTFITPSGDGLRGSFLGVDFAHGLEFWGHSAPPYMSLRRWEQTVMILVDFELCRSLPFVCTTDNEGEANEIVESAALTLGRRFVRLEATAQMSAEVLASLLRGCVESGTLLCLSNCEALPQKILAKLVLPLVDVFRAPTSPAMWRLPYGSDGAAVDVAVHPLFRLVFSSRTPTAVPRELVVACKVLRAAPVDVAGLVRDLLIRTGLIPADAVTREVAEFAEVYEQLKERRPDIFSISRLHAVVCDLAASTIDGTTADDTTHTAQGGSPSLLKSLLRSLSRTCAALFKSPDGLRLQASVERQIGAKLLGSCQEAPLSECCTAAGDSLELRGTGEAVLRRFTTLIECHRRVLVVGPRFSGKSQLWKRWVGNATPLILVPALISASDFYGTTSHKGFLSLMASHVVTASNVTAKAASVMVLEGVDTASSFELFTEPWFDGTHMIEGVATGTGIAAASALRVIGTAEKLQHITPGTVDGFAMLALAGPTDWSDGVAWNLRHVPDAQWAAKALEALLPPLVERAAKASAGLIGDVNELTNMCAIAQRAASLCGRWYTYALTVHVHTNLLTARDNDDGVDLCLFAVRCAVMAVSWSVGLSLPPEDRDAMKLTMLSAESDVMKALEGCKLSGDVFPKLTQHGVNILEQVVLPRGWVPFDDAASWTDLPLSWSSYRHMSSHLGAFQQVFGLPSRVPMLRATECLINCGQHVLLHGGAVSGKSTLLRIARANADWVAQLHDMNAGFHPTSVQQTVAGALARRSDGHYGPPVGRRLVVCIDDLHLSPLIEPDDEAAKCVPLAGSLIQFCQDFKAISTPNTGTMRTTDVVFCATTLLKENATPCCGTGALIGCVDVRLTAFDNEEMSNGLHAMCTMASTRKRAPPFLQECVNFLDRVHGVYCQLKKYSTAVASSLPPSPRVTLNTAAAAGVRPSAAGGPGNLQDERTGDTSTTYQPFDVPLFSSECLRDALEAADVVRLHLRSNLSDSQVAVRIFIGVTTFYEERLTQFSSIAAVDGAMQPPEPPTLALSAAEEAQQRKEEASAILRDAVVQAAEDTMRGSIRGDVEFRDLVQGLPEPFSLDSVSAAEEARVAKCVTAFPRMLLAEHEQDLATLEEENEGNIIGVHGSSAAAAAAAASTNSDARYDFTGSRAETRHASVLIRYPDSIDMAAVHPDTVNKGVYVRRVSAPQVPTAVLSRKASSFISTAATSIDALSAVSSATPAATQTYQTTWLTTRLVQLMDVLPVPGSHILFLGSNTFGLRRLFRLWCSSTHVPFMWFRAIPAATDAELCITFCAELRACVTYVCVNNLHAVAYVPCELMRVPEVLRIVDALVRSGDVSGLFTDAERRGLSSGHTDTDATSLEPLEVLDDTELRDRVRGCFNFVFHLRDASEARDLGKGYPFLLQAGTTAVPLYTDNLEEALVAEIVLGILRADSPLHRTGVARLADDDKESKNRNSDESAVVSKLPAKIASMALCSVFNFVRNAYPTAFEQLIDFVAVYKELNDTARVRVVESSHTSEIIANRGDAAVENVKRATRRSHGIEVELAAAQAHLSLLQEKLRRCEKDQATRAAEAQMAQHAAQEKKDVLQYRQSVLEDGLKGMEGAVEKAVTQLSKAKSTSMRALAASRVPDKGTLLVRSLYAVLGEVIPRHNDSPSELWSIFTKRTCTKEFAVELAAVPPESGEPRLPSLLLCRNEIDTVCYAPALPYAQLLADFVMAWVDCVRFRVEDYACGQVEVEKAQQDLSADERDAARKQNELLSAEKKTTETQEEIKELQETCAALQKEQRDLDIGEMRLMKYTGLVDRFSRFLIAPAGVAVRLRHARCANGDTILVSAFYTLLAMHGGARPAYAALRQLLDTIVRKPKLEFTAPEEACAYLLCQTHVPRTATLTEWGTDVPWEYTALLLSLYQRRAARWTLVRGADDLIEHELRKFLSFVCTRCVTLSVVDRGMEERLATAMRSGEGVLLRDVHDAASLDFVRSLNPVYQKLKEHHMRQQSSAMAEAKGGDTTANSTTAAATTQGRWAAGPGWQARKDAATPVVASVWMNGREVHVHPQFFLVCTAALVSSCRTQEACESLSVFNLNTAPEQAVQTSWHLSAVVRRSSVSTKVASMEEEVGIRRVAYFKVLQKFIQAHDAAAALLASSLRDISGNEHGDALLEETERMLARVDLYEGQLAQTASYVQSLRKMVREGWSPMLTALDAVTHIAEQIEAGKLYRPWSAAALDRCLAEIAHLPSASRWRAGPLLFSDLSVTQKCWYALMHYVQCVVDMLEPGWPVPLSGVFSLCVLCSALSAAPQTLVAEAKAPVLAREQMRVLHAVVFEKSPTAPAGPAGEVNATQSDVRCGAKGDAPLPSPLPQKSAEEHRRAIYSLYSAADDPLLRRLAQMRAEIATSETAEEGENCCTSDKVAFYVAQLFTALAERRVEQANHGALSLYTSFMVSVTSAQRRCSAASGRSSARPSARTIAATAPRSALKESVTREVAVPAGESAAAGVDGSGGATNSNINPAANTLSVEVQLRRATKANQPLCLVSDGPISDALVWLEYEVKRTGKWAFQWQELLPPPPTCVAEKEEPQRGNLASARWRATLLQTCTKVAEQIASSSKPFNAAESTPTCLAVVIDMNDHAKAAVAAADVRFLKEEWQRLLSLYATSTRLDTSNKESSFCLAVICSSVAQQLLRREALHSDPIDGKSSSRNTCATHNIVPCCYFPLHSRTPQLLLLNLLQAPQNSPVRSDALQICDAIHQQIEAELNARADGVVTSEKTATTTRVRGPALARIFGGQHTADVSASLLSSLPALPSGVASAALTALQSSVDELRSCVQLIECESAVVWVASTTRLRMSRTPGGAAAPSAAASADVSGGLNNPTPLPRLQRLLCAWVRQRYENLLLQLGTIATREPASCSISKAASSAGATADAAIKSGVSTQSSSLGSSFHPDAGSPTLDLNHDEGSSLRYGLQAYYYMRRTQGAWNLVLKKYQDQIAQNRSTAVPTAASTATVAADLMSSSVLSIMSAADACGAGQGGTFYPGTSGSNSSSAGGVGAASEDAISLARNRSKQRRRQCGLVEDVTAQWKVAVFVLARQYTFHCLSAPHSMSAEVLGGHGFPQLEKRSQWTMLQALVGAPDNAEEVTCLWGGFARGQWGADERSHLDLKISVHHVETFVTDVAACSSDLFELCGELAAAKLAQASCRDQLLELCYGATSACTKPKGGTLKIDVPAAVSGGSETHGQDGRAAAAVLLIALQSVCDAADASRVAPFTAAEAVFGWEQESFRSYVAQPLPFNAHFLCMLESFAFVVAPSAASSASAAKDATGETPTLGVWFPSLRHPLLDLRCLTAGVSPMLKYGAVNAAAGGGAAATTPRKLSPSRNPLGTPLADVLAPRRGHSRDGDSEAADGGSSDGVEELVLVATQRRFIVPSDVVLLGATLSFSLQNIVAGVTGWRGASTGNRADGGASQPTSSDAEETMRTAVVVIRRMLARPRKTRAEAVSREAQVPEAQLGFPAAPPKTVDVAMYVQGQGTSAPRRDTPPGLGQMLWGTTRRLQSTADVALSDTRPTCLNDTTPLTSASDPDGPAAATATPTDHAFLTTLETEAESAPGRFDDRGGLARAWSFSEVPVPVLWSSVAGDGKPRIIEFYLCVEYMPRGRHEVVQSPAVSLSPRGKNKEIGDAVTVASHTLPIHDVLDTFISIA